MSSRSAAIFGVFLCIGLSVLGYQLADAAIRFKQFERTVVVKGLSERDYPADTVIWPIKFAVASDDMSLIYSTLERNNGLIKRFLVDNGVTENQITISSPAITDKLAREYGGNEKGYRFRASQTITVYSAEVAKIRSLMKPLTDLGKQGILFTMNRYGDSAQYVFSRLNEVKPDMIEEATKNAREVAVKFANDSNSRLGKIKRASQGNFSIRQRDDNNPHMKRVRVVSTVTYYLAD